MDIRELIGLSKLSGPEDAGLFEMFRRQAFNDAASIYDDRTISYNVDHAPTEEMPYGVVSLASEIYKLCIRMTSLTSPMRSEEVRPVELERLLDTCVDVINYASWMYALAKIIHMRAQSGPPAQSVPERWITSHSYRNDQDGFETTDGFSKSCTFVGPTGMLCGKSRDEHAE